MHRLRGELLLKRDPSNPAPAEDALQSAIAVASEQGARSYRVLAALALAKLYQSTARPVDAHAVLACALEGFAATPKSPRRRRCSNNRGRPSRGPYLQETTTFSRRIAASHLRLAPWARASRDRPARSALERHCAPRSSGLRTRRACRSPMTWKSGLQMAGADSVKTLRLHAS
jgi:hypothetical protein